MVADHPCVIVVAVLVALPAALQLRFATLMQRHAACALANLVVENANHKTAIVSVGAIPPLVRLLESRNENTQVWLMRWLASCLACKRYLACCSFAPRVTSGSLALPLLDRHTSWPTTLVSCCGCACGSRTGLQLQYAPLPP